MDKSIPRITEEESAVGTHYDRSILTYELERLEHHSPVESGITTRCLRRWVPDKSLVVDVGVGAGVYAEALARRGCDLILVDVAEALLNAAAARLNNSGLRTRVRSVQKASATDLGVIGSRLADVVLFLGPLYHLRAPEAREPAVREAARILKPGGLLFAAGINRMAFLRDLFRDRPDSILERKDFCLKFIEDGNLDPEAAPPIGFAHLSTAEEFRRLFRQDFREIAMLGTESFTSPWQDKLANQPEPVREAWLDLVEATAVSQEGLGCADHFLYVGQRIR